MAQRPCWAAALVLGVLPASARGDDGQLWATAIIQGPIDTRTAVVPMVWMEVQSRMTNDMSHLGQFIVRPGFGLRFGPDFQALFGFHFQRNSPENGRDTSEHRTYEQLILPLYRDPEHLIVTTRLRLEQRSVDHTQDLGWRARAMVRLQLPLHGAGSAGPLIWSEAFVGLNDTDWGQRTGVRQVRAFAGGLVPIDKRLNFEGGYMAQFDRAPGNGRINHVIHLTLNYRLGK